MISAIKLQKRFSASITLLFVEAILAFTLRFGISAQNPTLFTDDFEDGNAMGYADSDPGDLVERFNLYVNSGVPQTRGAAFDASQYYQYSLAPASSVPDLIMGQAGAGKLP
jgi:pectate lyase